MIKRYCLAVLTGIVVLVYAGWLSAGALDDAVRRGVLKVGTTPTYVPFEMKDKQGRIVSSAIGGREFDHPALVAAIRALLRK